MRSRRFFAPYLYFRGGPRKRSKSVAPHSRTHNGPKIYNALWGALRSLLLFKVDRRRRAVLRSQRAVCERVCIVCVTCVHVHHANAHKTQNNITAAVIMHKRPWGI